MTGALDMGSQLINNVSTPSSSTDAANKSYVDTQIANLNQTFKVKPNARAASTADVTVSAPGTAVFDGVTLTSGDILFLRAQTAAAENGLYTFNGSGSALTRIAQMDAWAEVPGAFFSIGQLRRNDRDDLDNLSTDTFDGWPHVRKLRRRRGAERVD
jgi:hypothetical protein